MESVISSPSLSSLFNSANGSVTKDDYAEGGGEGPADGTLDFFVRFIKCLILTASFWLTFIIHVLLPCLLPQNGGLSPEVDWNGMPSSTSAGLTSAACSFSSRLSELTLGSEISVIAAAVASDSQVRRVLIFIERRC